MNLCDIGYIKALLERHGFRFSKSMGQNFLTAAWVPEDRFMIETDSPYLLPYPRVKGEKRNDSSKLPRIAAKIAALRGLTEAEVERITTENGKAFFRLP